MFLCFLFHLGVGVFVFVDTFACHPFAQFSEGATQQPAPLWRPQDGAAAGSLRWPVEKAAFDQCHQQHLRHRVQRNGMLEEENNRKHNIVFSWPKEAGYTDVDLLVFGCFFILRQMVSFTWHGIFTQPFLVLSGQHRIVKVELIFKFFMRSKVLASPNGLYFCTVGCVQCTASGCSFYASIASSICDDTWCKVMPPLGPWNALLKMLFGKEYCKPMGHPVIPWMPWSPYSTLPTADS